MVHSTSFHEQRTVHKALQQKHLTTKDFVSSAARPNETVRTDSAAYLRLIMCLPCNSAIIPSLFLGVSTFYSNHELFSRRHSFFLVELSQLHVVLLTHCATSPSCMRPSGFRLDKTCDAVSTSPFCVQPPSETQHVRRRGCDTVGCPGYDMTTRLTYLAAMVGVASRHVEVGRLEQHLGGLEAAEPQRHVDRGLPLRLLQSDETRSFHKVKCERAKVHKQKLDIRSRIMTLVKLVRVSTVFAVWSTLVCVYCERTHVVLGVDVGAVVDEVLRDVELVEQDRVVQRRVAVLQRHSGNMRVKPTSPVNTCTRTQTADATDATWNTRHRVKTS